MDHAPSRSPAPVGDRDRARWTALIGAVISTIDAALLAVKAPPMLGLLVTSVGAGIFRPCPYTTVATSCSGKDEPAALLPSRQRRRSRCMARRQARPDPHCWQPRSRTGPASSFGAGAAMFFLATIIMLVAALVAPRRRRPRQCPARRLSRACATTAVRAGAWRIRREPRAACLGVVGVGAVLFSARDGFRVACSALGRREGRRHLPSLSMLYTLVPSPRSRSAESASRGRSPFSADPSPLVMGAVGLRARRRHRAAAYGTAWSFGLGVVIAAIGEAMVGRSGAYAALDPVAPPFARRRGILCISTIMSSIASVIEAAGGRRLRRATALVVIAGGAVGIALAKRIVRDPVRSNGLAGATRTDAIVAPDHGTSSPSMPRCRVVDDDGAISAAHRALHDAGPGTRRADVVIVVARTSAIERARAARRQARRALRWKRPRVHVDADANDDVVHASACDLRLDENARLLQAIVASAHDDVVWPLHEHARIVAERAAAASRTARPEQCGGPRAAVGGAHDGEEEFLPRRDPRATCRPRPRVACRRPMSRRAARLASAALRIVVRRLSLRDDDEPPDDRRAPDRIRRAREIFGDARRHPADAERAAPTNFVRRHEVSGVAAMTGAERADADCIDARARSSACVRS
jgi:hypothetical protein